MQKILQYILPFKLTQKFSDSALGNRYEAWDMPSRQVQICAISALTALLYLIFTFLDKSAWVPEHVQMLMFKVYLLIIIPMMLCISYLAYQKRFYKLVKLLLAASPIIAMLCHVYLVS